MKQEKLCIARCQVQTIPGGLIRQDSPSGKGAFLFPGPTCRNTMPSLYCLRQLLGCGAPFEMV